MKSYSNKILVLVGLLVLVCAAVYREHAKGRDEQQLQCNQGLCMGDKLPIYDLNKYALFKVDSKFYIAPKEYGGTDGSLGFFWPSRAPSQRGDLAPEFRPSGPSIVSNFSDVAVEIFIRSPSGPTPPNLRGYKFIEEAVENNWVERKNNVKPGLDEYTMKHISGSDGYDIGQVKYYVAYTIIGADNLPPVATCGDSRADDTGGAGFLWQDLWVGVRMNQRHCADWAEIYPEITNILKQIKEIR